MGRQAGSGRIALFDRHWNQADDPECKAWAQLREFRIIPRGFLYLAVPWTELIEHLNVLPGGDSAMRRKFHDFQSRLPENRAAITVCCHAEALAYLPLFEACGVTELFWSHATTTDHGDEVNGKVRVLPFPVISNASSPGADKKFLHCLESGVALNNVQTRMLELASNKTGPLPRGTALAELVRCYGPMVRGRKQLSQPTARTIVAACKAAVLLADPEVLTRFDNPSMLSRLLDAAHRVLPDSEQLDAEFKELVDHVNQRSRPEAPSAFALPSRRTIKVCLVGEYGSKTPIGYPPMRPFTRNQIRFVSSPAEADVVLTGFVADFTENAAEMLRLAKANPNRKFVVLSEEPLWDRTWSDGFAHRARTLEHEGAQLRYTLLNHANSDIFDFDRIPYFILRDDALCARYRALMSGFAKLSPSELLEKWKAASFDAAFVAEGREDYFFRGAPPSERFNRMNAYRIEIAQHCSAKNVLRLGKGWPDQPTSLKPDGHLEKLAILHGRTRVLSAIENTHQRYYITEKVFDAFAVGAVPLYHASPEHHIFDLIPAAAMINTWDQTAESAAARVARFEPTRGMAVAWLRTCSRLAALLGDTEAIVSERRRAVDESLRELASLFNP